MKKALLILFICWLSLAGRGLAQIDSLLSLGDDNTVLYEQYAHRPGFTVAQLIHFPLDTNIFVNCLLIETDNDSIDSVFWNELEFAEGRHKDHPGFGCGFRGRYNLLEKAPLDENGKVDIPNSSLVLVDYNLNRYWVFYCKSWEIFLIIHGALSKKIWDRMMPSTPKNDE